MAKCFGLNDLSEIASCSFFFDANVLIYLFGISTGGNWEVQYAKIYSRLLTNTNLFVDFTVISEFINSVVRIAYQSHINFNNISAKQFSYKDYRNSIDGLEILKGVYETVRLNILDKFKLNESSFSHSDILEFLTNDSLDFNDKAIKQICLKNDYILVTNDSDFKNTNINILTANNKLLIESS